MNSSNEEGLEKVDVEKVALIGIISDVFFKPTDIDVIRIVGRGYHN